MHAAKSASFRVWQPIVVAAGIMALVSVCRALGFGEGVILGATPASGLALAATLVLRRAGALAAVAGFAIGDLAWGLTPGEAATDAIGHGIAALFAAATMRAFARRRRPETKTHEWLIFLAGVAVFTA